MLLLVSGASCVGKSTARMHARKLLDDRFEDAELFTLGPIPATPTIAWRQEQCEVAVRRAAELAAEGRHLLFAGDPIPAGEILAVPSADRVDVAVCLLDADDEALTQRLDARQDPPELWPRHLAWAAWLRAHATDPGHLPDAVTTDAWPEMVWERWTGRRPGPEWAMTVLDTTDRSPAEVGRMVADWCLDAVDHRAPVFGAGWWR